MSELQAKTCAHRFMGLWIYWFMGSWGMYMAASVLKFLRLLSYTVFTVYTVYTVPSLLKLLMKPVLVIIKYTRALR